MGRGAGLGVGASPGLEHGRDPGRLARAHRVGQGLVHDVEQVTPVLGAQRRGWLAGIDGGGRRRGELLKGTCGGPCGVLGGPSARSPRFLAARRSSWAPSSSRLAAASRLPAASASARAASRSAVAPAFGEPVRPLISTSPEAAVPRNAAAAPASRASGSCTSARSIRRWASRASLIAARASSWASSRSRT